MASKLEKILITAGIAGLLIGGEIKIADNIYKTEQDLLKKFPLAKKTYDMWTDLTNFGGSEPKDLAQYQKKFEEYSALMKQPDVITERREYIHKLKKTYSLNILPQGLLLGITVALAINYLGKLGKPKKEN